MNTIKRRGSIVGVNLYETVNSSSNLIHLLYKTETSPTTISTMMWVGKLLDRVLKNQANLHLLYFLQIVLTDYFRS